MVGRPFAKGQSGNPGGRPRQLAAVQALARRHTVAAIKVLHEISKGEHGAKAADMSKAAETLLARGWGQPTQPVNLSGEGGGAITIQLVSFDGEGGKPEGEPE